LLTPTLLTQSTGSEGLKSMRRDCVDDAIPAERVVIKSRTNDDLESGCSSERLSI
jgi:hypothetical protein